MHTHYPGLHIDLKKIEHNARSITARCQQHGIQVAGVTKVVCAMPSVAESMLRGGCRMLGDSRIENLQRLREQGLDAELLLLRLPMISEAAEVVRVADLSLNSELATIQALDAAAAAALQVCHKIILMLDVGDLREGIWPDQIDALLPEILACEHIALEGIGCNVGCYGGVMPTPENMGVLARNKQAIEARYGIHLNIVSGGSSNGLKMVESGSMPPDINHVRVGEAILLGRDPADRSCVPGTVQDACVVQAEIIECRRKPSVPIGVIGQDAFGQVPQFENKGLRMRAILALGRQDVHVEGLTPLDPDVTILGASSDHLLVDVTDAARSYRVGEVLPFYPDYAALLALSTSPYVSKHVSA